MPDQIDKLRLIPNEEDLEVHMRNIMEDIREMNEAYTVPIKGFEQLDAYSMEHEGLIVQAGIIIDETVRITK